MNYLLDTNHLSPLVTSGHFLRQRILNHIQSGDVFAITVPVLSEFLFGIGTLPRAVQNLREWQNQQNQFRFYGLNFDDATKAAELRLSLRRQEGVTRHHWFDPFLGECDENIRRNPRLTA